MWAADPKKGDDDFVSTALNAFVFSVVAECGRHCNLLTSMPVCEICLFASKGTNVERCAHHRSIDMPRHKSTACAHLVATAPLTCPPLSSRCHQANAHVMCM